MNATVGGVRATEALDSRLDPTVRMLRAPNSGATVAVESRDGGKQRHDTKGALRVVANVYREMARESVGHARLGRGPGAKA